MSKGLYCVSLIDYALPGFCSGTKEYCGTKEAIISVLSNPKTERDDLLQAAKIFFAGEGDGRAAVLYSEGQFLSRLLCLGEGSLSISNFTHTHYNIWGFEYWMRAKRMDCRFVYVMDNNGKYRRAFQLTFENLEYSRSKSPNARWKEISAEDAWGHPNVLRDLEPRIMQNQLLIFDRVFKTKAELRKDMDRPEDADYTLFFNEIFADG